MSKTIKLVDPQLNSIDDCLYRVAVRIVAMKDQKVLVVTEASYPGQWVFPGGIPRINLFFRAELSASPQTTSEISDLAWCDR